MHRQYTIGRSTQDAIDVFFERAEEHVEVARRMLVDLWELFVIQPPETHKACGESLLVNNLLVVVH